MNKKLKKLLQKAWEEYSIEYAKQKLMEFEQKQDNLIPSTPDYVRELLAETIEHLKAAVEDPYLSDTKVTEIWESIKAERLH